MRAFSFCLLLFCPATAAFADDPMPDLCLDTDMGRDCWNDDTGMPTGACFTGSSQHPGAVCSELPGLSSAPGELQRFIWTGISGRGPNHQPPGPMDAFSEDELCALAGNEDLVVIERGHAGGDLELQGCAVRLLKALNPDLRVLLYFPAERILETDPWWASFDAEEAPDLSWRLVSQSQKHWVDTSNEDYREWATETVVSLMDDVGGQPSGERVTDPPWDGVAFDLAYGYMHISDVLRDDVSGVDPDTVFEGVAQLVRETQDALDALTPQKERVVIYNGLTAHMSPEQACLWRHTRPLAGDLDSGVLCGGRQESALPPQTTHATGVVNEYFCYEKDANTPYSPNQKLQDPDFLRRDLEVQREAAEAGSWVIANMQYNRMTYTDDPPAHNNLDEVALAPNSRYCYASYLMAQVPGKTTFKRSGRTDVRSIGETVAEEQLDLGQPLGEMVVGDQWDPSWPAAASTTDDLGGGLLSRNFENFWVVANLDPVNAYDFTAPESVTPVVMVYAGGQWTETAGMPLVAGDTLSIASRDAVFLKKPQPAGTPPAGGCAEGLSPSGYTGGALGWLGRERTSLEGVCCDLETSCSQGGVCYPREMIISQSGGTEDACLDTTGFGPALYTCDASRAGDVITHHLDGAPVDWYRCAAVQDGATTRYRFEPVSFNNSAQPSAQGCVGGQNVARFMGTGFGEDWAALSFVGRFENCCNPLTACNQGECYAPGSALPWRRAEDQVCSKSATWTNPQGTPVAAPGIHTCSASTVGDLITDSVTGTQHCCSEVAPGLYRFEDPNHIACAAPPGLPGCTAPQSHDRVMATAFGTDWTSIEVQGALAACCDPSLTCNGGDACYAPGTRPLRQRQGSDELCADVGAGPAFYTCDARNAGQTLGSSPGPVWCCQASGTGGDATYAFVSGACP
ncbi:MAG: hypothetical protein AAGM22_07525 [Acidobacteriota bacterium]